jgi:alanyl-tRNA synthetase
LQSYKNNKENQKYDFTRNTPTVFRFFKSKEHLIVPSAPIVLKDDPTLMFSNSGMTQFKDYFLGYKEPKSHRIADTQKCLRVW